MRKPVFGVCDQVRHKPACSATQISYRLEISAIARRGIILSRQRTTKALIRLHGCIWNKRFSHGAAHMIHFAKVSIYKGNTSETN